MGFTASYVPVSSVALTIAVPFMLVALILGFTSLYTSLQYRYQLRACLASADKSYHPKQPLVVTPPQLPYTIPWLGQARSWFAPKPGQFWEELFSWYPREAGTCKLLLGGEYINCLFAPSAVQMLMKLREPHRERSSKTLVRVVLNLTEAEADSYYSDPDDLERVHHQYMLKNERVNELTAKFASVLAEGIQKQQADLKLEADGSLEVGLYSWVQNLMFSASTTALMGSRLLEVYPDLCKDFYKFDQDFLSFFFRMPRFLIPDAYARRERMQKIFSEWNDAMYKESGGQPIDPEAKDVDWEPCFGSRLNRARQIQYRDLKLSTFGASGLDMGLLFGLSSNAIPCTGWMLLHLLDPKGDPTVLPRVMAEIRTAQRPDGTLDIPTLIALPLLQSVMQECLRLYTDVLLTRDLPNEVLLPLNDEGTKVVRLAKGTMVLCPSYLGHYDQKSWPDAMSFKAERFLTTDPATGQPRFTMTGTTGKLFPFGGGKTICPGRVFAKQEVMGAVAMFLTSFDYDVGSGKIYTDSQGEPVDHFPGVRDGFLGSGVQVMNGDMKVRIRAKKA